MKIFAKSKEDISSAAIDFFSFGHLLIGYLLFIVLNAIYFVFFENYQFFLCIISDFLCALIWELIENTLFYRKNIKFGYRRDSTLNSLSDISFLVIGGLLALLNFSLGFSLFLINTIIIFILIAFIMKY
ncbi:MAG: DUF2585 family protein, partial [Candidatus Lokiarchaeota archaeon]|nr:DUF2585 family protein [Candidatus Lokiarchaeota archaeon]